MLRQMDAPVMLIREGSDNDSSSVRCSTGYARPRRTPSPVQPNVSLRYRSANCTSSTVLLITSSMLHLGGLGTLSSLSPIFSTTCSSSCSVPPATPELNFSCSRSPTWSQAVSMRSRSSLVCAAETQNRARDETSGVAGYPTTTTEILRLSIS